MTTPADPPEDEDHVPSGKSSSGVPSEGEVLKDRFSSDEVFQRIIADADEELTTGRRELFFSGVAGGFAISITFLLYASMYASTDGHPILSVLLYPIGFIYIIIGGYQLYTENTLPPVALTLERLASFTALFRHWVIVLAGNFAGGAVGAVILAWGGVFSPEAAIAAVEIGEKGKSEAWWDLFFKGAFAGLIVAGVVWVEFAARDTISRVVVIYLAFLAIPLGNLYHVVVSFTEALYIIFVADAASLVAMTDFVLPVLLGNTLGGVVLVTLVNYYQTSEHRLGSIAEGQDITRLSMKEWIFGSFAGRSYVPLIEHHEPTTTLRDPDSYHVFIPISNPRTEESLVRLGCSMAAQHPNSSVHIAHMIQPPKNLSYQYNREQRQRITDASNRQLEPLRELAQEYDTTVDTSTLVSYSALEEILNQARQATYNLVVMGWEKDQKWDTVKTGRPLEELTSSLPCDFLVVRDRGLDLSRILVPTAGGPDSGLSAEVAVGLRSEFGSDVSLLYVVDEPEAKEGGEQFLAEWAGDHDLEDANLIVDVSGDVEGAIERHANDHSLLLLGATERGMISRLASSSLHMDVVNEVECSVILAERPQKRSLFERLFSRGSRK